MIDKNENTGFFTNQNGNFFTLLGVYTLTGILILSLFSNTLYGKEREAHGNTAHSTLSVAAVRG